jgi:hypothetical protein
MIVLLPVSRFRVAYEIARGRPYSRLERRVLEAIAERGATLRDLTAAFQVHERLLVESVVTLVNVGWVALAGGAEATFVLTAEGKAAVDTGRDPVSVVVSQARPQIVILERVTGQLARRSEARAYRREDLADVWESAAFVQSRIPRNKLDEARVQKLLPSGQGEWIRWVGPITLASKNTHFVPVDVSDESDEVHGLPPAWLESVTPHAVAAARRQRARNTEHAIRPAHHGDTESARPTLRTSPRARRASFVSVAAQTSHQPFWQAKVALRQDDVLIGAEVHDCALALAMDSAVGNLLIATPGIDPAHLTAFLADAAGAVKRHIRVDVLPGTTPDMFQQSAVLDAINRAGYQAIGNEARALLRSGRQATGSGASLLLYDEGPGRLVAVVGDYDWLGTPSTSTPVSIRVADQRVVGNLARAAASLWGHAQPGPDTGTADRWRHLAGAAEERGAEENAVMESAASEHDTIVEVIIDDEHVNPPVWYENKVRVGRFCSETDSGQDSPRGISLQLTGPGARLVRSLKENS